MRVCVAVIVAVAGCLGDASQGRLLGSGGPGDGRGAVECVDDVQCVAAGSACCDCPTFAVPSDDLTHQACVGVTCPPAACPANVHAACVAGRCALACKVMECEQSCPDGFATGDNGCLTCACAAPVVDGCTRAADCVEVRGDCCGCENGGHDTAVLRRDAADHDLALGCGPMPRCPVANTCSADAAPQCLQGRCALTTGAALPPGACGRSDLPPCQDGEVCVINAAEPTASQQGLGICLNPGP